LTSTEAQALFLLVGPAASAAPEAKAALRKLVRALPATFRADAEAAADAVVVDAARWGGADRTRPALLDVLEPAIVARRKVELTYANSEHHRSTRSVDPWGLIDKDDVWYLVAGTERGQRTFRVDRIEEVLVTDVLAQRPADLELAAIWARVVEEMEQRRGSLSATLLIDAGFVRVLRTHFGRHCEVMSIAGDGRAQVRVAAPSPRSIAEQLAGWGGQVEVIEPASVRNELARIGAELSSRYSVDPVTAQPVG
jgi:predicted DNA-binding transcriptional regulator YafY